MNRRLKFRIWSKKDTNFLHNIEESHDLLHSDGEWYFLGGNKLDENYAIQQWTGLYDKNKKPIYEGDIVNVQRSFTRPYVKDGKMDYKTIDGGLEVGQVIWWMIKAAFLIAYKGYDDMEDFPYCYSCEVIGNIFENSELLKNE
jgi:uncharacterized phage protein (TIGR01671 family)